MKLCFIDEEEIIKNRILIPEAKRLYNLCFPDINEREEFSHILRRVRGLKKKSDPNTILVLYIFESEVIAGMVADWYRESNCIHLTYLFVHPKYRNKGIAKNLLGKVTNSIIDQIFNKYGIKILAIFLEANNPSQTQNDSFNPDLRLKIFKKIGIRIIDIPYVQPALDRNKIRVKNLYLLTIPIFSYTEIKIDYVIEFLRSLYKSLNIKKPEDDLDYIEMITYLHQQKDINNFINLKQIN